MTRTDMTPASPDPLDRSLRLLAPILGALPCDGLLAWDATGSFAPGATGLASGAGGALAGRSLTGLEADGEAVAVVAAVRTALAGTASEIDWRPKGGEVLHRVRCVPLADEGSVVGAAAVVLRHPDTPDASGSASRLERCERDLRHFAYVTSHDLSEPVRVMSGYAGMLERRYEDQLDERGRRYIASIVAGAQHLNELLEALLAYSRARSQPLESVPVDLDETLAAVRGDLAARLAGRAAELTADPLPTVTGDPRRIAAVLTELVANAIEFSPGRPRIHVGAADAGAAWEVSVRDEGIGIDPDQHERVFELLQRLHSREDHPGTGAGLTVARETARAHGGDLRLESEPGAGSVFTLVLPKPDPAAGVGR